MLRLGVRQVKLFIGEDLMYNRYKSHETIAIIITKMCNLRCKYCFEDDHSVEHVDVDKVKETLTYLLSLPPAREQVLYYFFGGEPFLRIDEVIELADFIHEKETRPYQILFFTNGTQFGNEKVRKFIERDKEEKQIVISIDGCPETHNEYRCNSFDTIMEYFWWWRKLFPAERVRGTMTPETIVDLFKNFKYMYQVLECRNYIEIEFAHGPGIAWKDEHCAILEGQLEQIADYLLGMNNPPEFSMFKRYSSLLIGEQAQCGCGVLYKGIDVDGTIYPCSGFAAERMYPLGKTIDDDKIEPFRFVGYARGKECLDCELRLMCFECPYVRYKINNSIFENTPITCSATKVIAKVAKSYFERSNKLDYKV
jgi:radical SAM protein with 4Fe4S-binding SPASM domain